LEIDKKINKGYDKSNNKNNKMATEKQINYFKTKLTGYGVESNKDNIKKILDKCGFNVNQPEDLATTQMSKLIDLSQDMVKEMILQ
jgi:hypothetical protein